VKWEVFKRNTWFPDLWCSSLRILNGTKSYCLFASQREIGICSKNKSLNNFFFEKKCLSFPLSILKRPLPIITSISDEILGFASATFKNKQKTVFCLFLKKTNKGKLKSYHSWIGQVQAKLQWRQNAMSFCFFDKFSWIFLKLSPFCEILNAPANRAKILLAAWPQSV